MKKKDWYRTFGLADDKYVAEAHPDKKIKAKKKAVFLSLGSFGALGSVVAACACFLLIACNLWLFLPYSTTPPSVAEYKDSEYYGLIQKLNVLTYEPPKYKNNADVIFSEFSDILLSMKGGLSNAAPDMGGSSPDDGADSSGGYKEVTDNQVAGVIEADRIKRSDTHIYYLSDAVLRVYAIDKENTREVGQYAIYGGSENVTSNNWEFFLSSDCKTVTVIAQSYIALNGVTTRCVDLIALDVSNPEKIVERESFRITGNYMTSRLTDGSILLLTEYAFNKGMIDFDRESSFLPQIDTGDGLYSIPADGIVSPDRLNDTRYTVVMKLDEDTLELQGTAAYLSYSEEVYVSEDHVFLTHVFADTVKNGDGDYTRNSMTEISALTYGGDAFEIKGNVTVRGYVKDQWSMDEYEGILRVFTTTNATTVQRESGSVSTGLLQTATGDSNASLYCIDLSSFEIVASVIDFAPPREEIRSVRFDGDAAYVCTSIELSDPVFFFDLSDLNNITFKDTGTIEGFSTSLINLGNGYLLGIGQGNEWGSCKVEVYEETADGVRAICAYELERAYYSTEYKSYYVDRQNQFFGFAAEDHSYYTPDPYDGKKDRYILLYFDGYELVELVNVPLAGDLSRARGVYIDGYMYMFASEGFKVAKVFE